jgi:hypothetical protein
LKPQDARKDGGRPEHVTTARTFPLKKQANKSEPAKMTGSLLDISGDDVARLGDGDLRYLVARLCEAEMRRRELPTSAVTAGGQQEATDAGVDVRVALPASTVISGYVPRPSTAFQVKKSDMPPMAIAKEMRPKGKVRAILRELAAEGGA